MEVVTLLALAGLALVDSTSIGTLVLPLVLLVAPRVDARRFVVYLATVGGFYALVGVGLVLGASALTEIARSAGDLTPLRWAQLVVGAALLAAGVVGDKVLERVRARRGTPAPSGRTQAWAERIVGEHASYRVVVAVGISAALVEVASMLPFLAAVGIITAADLPVAGAVGVVVAYALVMVLPAALLLVLRLALAGRVEVPLARFSAWLATKTQGAIWWVLAIVGFFVAGDAYGALSQSGAL
ncbi:GAP family protein [Nocardioides zeae]|uniref:GAP family protein n=1 Tax=Nocardioides imazamoxiresistens TaxID=3231893 RepID=A0ABU3PVJ4_9ACTN|nr:GAP family protein [Nocardioides zeae]MDT9592896.1 GAP family protein [Nocardioides zeae]